MITATVDIAVENQIPLWSYQNKVMIDFSGIEPTEALIHILDISGRSVITEKVKSGSMYTREISNIAASYILVEIAVGHRRFSRLLYLTEPQS